MVKAQPYVFCDDRHIYVAYPTLDKGALWLMRNFGRLVLDSCTVHAGWRRARAPDESLF